VACVSDVCSLATPKDREGSALERPNYERRRVTFLTLRATPNRRYVKKKKSHRVASLRSLIARGSIMPARPRRRRQALADPVSRSKRSGLAFPSRAFSARITSLCYVFGEVDTSVSDNQTIFLIYHVLPTRENSARVCAFAIKKFVITRILCDVNGFVDLAPCDS